MNSRISRESGHFRALLLAFGVAAWVGGASPSAGLVEWLDPTFGDEGTADVNLGSPAGLAQQTDGKLIVGGMAHGAITVARFTAEGRPDPVFGIDGTAMVENSNRSLETPFDLAPNNARQRCCASRAKRR